MESYQPHSIGTNNNRSFDEDQVAIVTAIYKMKPDKRSFIFLSYISTHRRSFSCLEPILFEGWAARSSKVSRWSSYIVLAVIGLIIGAVAIAKDVQRNAEYQKTVNKFAYQWKMSYDQYY